MILPDIRNFVFFAQAELALKLSMRLKVHKHEIILNFFLPKSNPYMPFVNFQKYFASFPLIFARISMFEHYRGV
jgi:hypothetical protein